MPLLDQHLHYRMIDVSSIKELAKRWYPRIYQSQPAKGLAHRALADILESIQELKFYRSTLFVAPPGPDTATAREIAARYGSKRPGTAGGSAGGTAAGAAGGAGEQRARGARRAARASGGNGGRSLAPAATAILVSAFWRRHLVGVAQLVEHLVVVQDVAGSSPVTRR